MAVVTNRKHDMDGVMTLRCSLMVEVRMSMIYRAHLVMLNLSGVALSLMHLV